MLELKEILPSLESAYVLEVEITSSMESKGSDIYTYGCLFDSIYLQKST